MKQNVNCGQRSGGVLAMPLAEMNVSFIRPAPAGLLTGKGTGERGDEVVEDARHS